jgi:pectate lyase
MTRSTFQRMAAAAAAAVALVLVAGTAARAQALFSDDFNDGNANGWTATSGSWSVATDGTPVYRVGTNGGNVRSNTGNAAWANYSVQARIKPLSFSSTSVRWVSLLGRYRDTGNYYYVALQNDNVLRLRRFVGSSSTTLAERAFTVTTGTWYTVRLEMNGSALAVFVNGVAQLTASDGTFPTGRIGVAGYGASASYDDVVVSPIGAATPDFSLSATPSAVSVARNGQGATTVNITRTGGFAGSVAFNPVQGLPTGVTATFNPASTTGGSTSLTFAATSAAPLGTTTVTVSGTGTPGTRTTSVALTVTAGTGTPDFSLSASPASVSVARNGQSSTTVNITRSGGFTGSVAFNAVAGLPAGVTAAFSPTSTTGNSTSLTFTANGSAPLGTTNLTVSGTGSPGTRSTPVSLTVTGGSSNTGLVGFGAFNGTTTGGAGGTDQTVNNAADFTAAINSAGARIVRVQGTITISGMVQVSSNKSILGIGSNAVISGGGLNISEDSNIIIRNIKFQNSDDDGINVQESSHHIWIDHCDFTNHFDGALDIKRASDFITVSWNHFYDQDKNMLLGHSDDNGAQDRGHLRVTYHHNWFDGTTQRNPRTRFGNPVHVFNNYYLGVGDYGIASTMESGVRAENNYFENTESPMELGQGSSPAGTLVQNGNVFVNSGPPVSSGSVNAIPYAYTLEAASSVAGSVRAGAGVGRITP